MEDFRDWTNWLLYRGGIGVKGEESWEAWWDEELVSLHFKQTSGSMLNEILLFWKLFLLIYYCLYVETMKLDMFLCFPFSSILMLCVEKILLRGCLFR